MALRANEFPASPDVYGSIKKALYKGLFYLQNTGINECHKKLQLLPLLSNLEQLLCISRLTFLHPLPLLAVFS